MVYLVWMLLGSVDTTYVQPVGFSALFQGCFF